jgi:hypothetical protein
MSSLRDCELWRRLDPVRVLVRYDGGFSKLGSLGQAVRHDAIPRI